jgi:hypothetical protein
MADFSILKQAEVSQAQPVASVYPTIPTAAPIHSFAATTMARSNTQQVEAPPSYNAAVQRKMGEAAGVGLGVKCEEKVEQKQETKKLKDQEVQVGMKGGYQVGTLYFCLCLGYYALFCEKMLTQSPCTGLQ